MRLKKLLRVRTSALVLLGPLLGGCEDSPVEPSYVTLTGTWVSDPFEYADINTEQGPNNRVTLYLREGEEGSVRGAANITMDLVGDAYDAEQDSHVSGTRTGDLIELTAETGICVHNSLGIRAGMQFAGSLVDENTIEVEVPRIGASTCADETRIVFRRIDAADPSLNPPAILDGEYAFTGTSADYPDGTVTGSLTFTEQFGRYARVNVSWRVYSGEAVGAPRHYANNIDRTVAVLSANGTFSITARSRIEGTGEPITPRASNIYFEGTVGEGGITGTWNSDIVEGGTFVGERTPE